jgi:hypothetical protein
MTGNTRNQRDEKSLVAPHLAASSQVITPRELSPAYRPTRHHLLTYGDAGALPKPQLPDESTAQSLVLVVGNAPFLLHAVELVELVGDAETDGAP